MTRIYAPNRIKELRIAKGMSLEAVGAAMPSDLTASTVAKLENRKMALSLDYIREIAGVLGVEPGDILSGEGPSVRIIPVAGLISAGNWRDAVEMSEESIAVPPHLKGDRLFALRPDGDSMDRIVPAGDDGGFIVVDPDQRDLVDGKYYAIANQLGETTFKRFSQNPLELQPCSNNPAHRAIPVGSEPFMVIGRVVYVGQEL